MEIKEVEVSLSDGKNTATVSTTCNMSFNEARFDEYFLRRCVRRKKLKDNGKWKITKIVEIKTVGETV